MSPHKNENNCFHGKKSELDSLDWTRVCCQEAHSLSLGEMPLTDPSYMLVRKIVLVRLLIVVTGYLLGRHFKKKYFGGFLHGICEGFSSEITIKCELMPNRTKNYTAPLIVSIKVESSKVSPLPSPKKAGENFIILYFI